MDGVVIARQNCMVNRFVHANRKGLNLTPLVVLTPSISANVLTTKSQIMPGVADLGIERHFCDACAKCARYGEQSGQLAFLMGRHFLNITSGDSISSNSCTGLNRLFQGQSSNKVWRDVDSRSPGFMRKTNEFRWAPAEPTTDPAIIYDKAAKRMRDTGLDCTWINARVYCEHGGSLSDSRNLYRFHPGFLASVTKLVESRAGYIGCCEQLPAFTQIWCARKCALNPHCRSVYFHKQDRRCILMLYADALLPAKLVRSRNRWTRFGKVANEEK
ncbi:PAN domain protein [Opisthorchis viverrini]|uniref:PAN domain protein n=1 Tax=Opisthorchis viverrini TaxID=6198 RepID=A0A1S8X8S4_OPIVI|nr:PAN domain protein [Opisthorchis viverrini]